MKIIGDIHGDVKYYDKMIKSGPTVQVGDFGFANAWNYLHYEVDPTKHQVLGGNHDDYSLAPQCKHYLGDFGYCTRNEIPFYYVRGGFSIDRLDRQVEQKYRYGVKTYWAEEELNFAQMLRCKDDYTQYSPDLIITHECPSFIVDLIHKDGSILAEYGHSPHFKSNTALLLEELYHVHRPKVWVFGHHHKSFRYAVGNTRFIGLAIGETYEP